MVGNIYKNCDKCNGSGNVTLNYKKCDCAHGEVWDGSTGSMRCPSCMGVGGFYGSFPTTCPKCNGSGQLRDKAAEKAAAKAEKDAEKAAASGAAGNSPPTNVSASETEKKDEIPPSLKWWALIPAAVIGLAFYADSNNIETGIKAGLGSAVGIYISLVILYFGLLIVYRSIVLLAQFIKAAIPYGILAGIILAVGWFLTNS